MKNKPLFYKIYFSVIAVFLVLLIVGLFFLNSVLAVYESAQPTVIVNDVVEKYLQNGDLYGAAQKYGISISKYDTKENVNKAFKEFVNGEKLSVGSSGKKLEGYTEVYGIKAGDESVVTLFLKKADKAEKYGIKGYKIGAAEFNDDFYNNIEFIVPSDVRLEINGIEVDKSDRVNIDLPKVLTDKIGDKEIIVNQSFKPQNFVSKDFTYKAFSSDGKEVEIVEANGVYTVAQGIDENELNNLKNHAINASQGYAKFMQEDASLGSISHFFDTSTEFYKYVRKTELWVWTHNGYRFEDVTFGEAHKYNDNLYSCRVSFTHILTWGNKIYKDYFDKYIYIEKTANGLKVIDMQSITAK